MVLLFDGNNTSNILPFNLRVKKDACSMHDSQIYTLADGFDHTFHLKQDLELIMVINNLCKCYRTRSVNSMELLDLFLSQKRSLIYFAFLIDEYPSKEISDVGHVSLKNIQPMFQIEY